MYFSFLQPTISHPSGLLVFQIHLQQFISLQSTKCIFFLVSKYISFLSLLYFLPIVEIYFLLVTFIQLLPECLRWTATHPWKRFLCSFAFYHFAFYHPWNSFVVFCHFSLQYKFYHILGCCVLRFIISEIVLSFFFAVLRFIILCNHTSILCPSCFR